MAKYYISNIYLNSIGGNFPNACLAPRQIGTWNSDSITFLLDIYYDEAAFLNSKKILESVSINVNNGDFKTDKVINPSSKMESEVQTPLGLYNKYNFANASGNDDLWDKLILLLKTEDLSKINSSVNNWNFMPNFNLANATQKTKL